MSAYKNTLATTSSPNLKYNTVDTSKTQSPTTNNSPSQAEDSPRTRIRLTQTSKNIASLAKEGGTDSPEKKKSKDDSFIKESSTGIVKNNPSEPKQMSRATISISKKNHMDLMTNIKNMRAQSPTLQKGRIYFIHFFAHLEKRVKISKLTHQFIIIDFLHNNNEICTLIVT